MQDVSAVLARDIARAVHSCDQRATDRPMRERVRDSPGDRARGLRKEKKCRHRDHTLLCLSRHCNGLSGAILVPAISTTVAFGAGA